MGRRLMGHPEGLCVSAWLPSRAQPLPSEPLAASWSSGYFRLPSDQILEVQTHIQQGAPPGMLHIVGTYNKFPK